MFHFLKCRDREKMHRKTDRSSGLAKPLSIFVVPGMYLYYKYNEYKRHQEEVNRNTITEKELNHLNAKIDKLLAKFEDKDIEPTADHVVAPSMSTELDEECVICMSAKATMQTYPCGHKVICRKCFIKTIQVAVSQRCLPLKCVICRSRILNLRQSSSVKLPSAKRPRSKLPLGGPRFGKHSKVYAK